MYCMRRHSSAGEEEGCCDERNRDAVSPFFPLWKSGPDSEWVASLAVLPGGHVAHGSVDGDSATVEALDHFAHLFPVFVHVFPPLAGSLRLEHSDHAQ